MSGLPTQVCAIIVEPILAEGGDVFLSNEFARGLRKLTEELGIYFIVDEVQTGVVTSGTFWMHEQWGLPTPPDYVLFAKKMLSPGFYQREELALQTPYRHFNTYMGDAARFVLTGALVDTVLEENLFEKATKTGAYLKSKLESEIGEQFPSCVSNVRGRGTFLAFDCADGGRRDALRAALLRNGVLQGPCGTRTLRFRPCLVFGREHADVYCERLVAACKEVEEQE